MARFDNPLDSVRIAAPCKADWEQMFGTDRVRFCGQCNLNVYNLSSMTRHDAESFVARNEGRLCVRFYRRGDGSILTQNCPVGLRAIRRRLSYLALVVTSAILTFFAGIGVYKTMSAAKFSEPALMGVMLEPIGRVSSLREPDSLEILGQPLVGRVAQVRGKEAPDVLGYSCLKCNRSSTRSKHRTGSGSDRTQVTGSFKK